MSRDSHSSENLMVACCAVLLSIPVPSFAENPGGAPTAKLPNRAGAATMTTIEETKPKGGAAQDSTVAEMLKLGALGEKHAWLETGEGIWKATVQQWSPSGEPIVSEGTSTQKLTLGGRFLEQRFLSTMFGQPFEGFGLTGYDNQREEFQSFWIDNTTTGMMMMSGTLDSTGTVLTLKGTMMGPDGKPLTVRSVTRIADDKTQVYSMYGLVGSQEQLMMKITYTKI